MSATEVLSNNAVTTLAQAVTTTPPAGSVEIWYVVSTAGRFPQVATGQQFHLTVGAEGDDDPEICIVQDTLDHQRWQLSRGAEGSTIKTHDVGELCISALTVAALESVIDASITTGLDRYVYTQSVPAASATIVHNLNRYPTVTLTTLAGEEVEGDVDYIDPNTLTVTFSVPFSWIAYLI